MKLIVIEVEELEKLLRQIIREELRRENPVTDEIGGIRLAQEITGLKKILFIKR